MVNEQQTMGIGDERWGLRWFRSFWFPCFVRNEKRKKKEGSYRDTTFLFLYIRQLRLFIFSGSLGTFNCLIFILWLMRLWSAGNGRSLF